MRAVGFFLLVFFPTVLTAQRNASPEVFVRGGLGSLWDDEGKIGTGPSVAGGIGIKLPHRIGIEAIVERHASERSFSSGVSFESTTFAAMARLAKYVGGGPAQPYFGGAIGRARVHTIGEFPGFPRNER